MTEYLPRSAWTSTSASGAALSGGSLRGVAVHWPGTSQATIGAASKSSIASRLRSYRSFHVNTRGWRDIGYNIAIDQAGRVWMLRSTQWHGNLVGAHAASGSNPNANHHYVGVLLLLGASETPSAAMVAAFRDWYHNRFLPKWPGRTDVRGHGQVPGAQTSCPGSRARAAISTMTAKPSGGSGSPTNGDTMSWNETLEPTSTAAKRFPDGYTKKAGKVLMHVLGLAYQGVYGKIAPNGWMTSRWPDMPDAGYSPRVYWRSGYGHARQAKEEAIANGKQIGKLAGEVAGLRNAVEQLAGNAGQPIDMAAVQSAALAGAQAAMAELSITVTVEPAEEPDGSEPDPVDATDA